MNWESFLSRPIPFEEAASYFLSMTKKAEWSEPPDMTGTLEGAFSVPVEQVLHQLKIVTTAKLRLMMAYFVYAQSLNNPAWGGVKKEFYDHAEMEQEGIEYYLKRAAVLGGPIQLDPIEPPPPSVNIDTILTTMVRGEQEGIAAQRVLRQMVGDENPMKTGIEEQMLKDQHHLDELFQMMTPEHRLMLEQSAASNVSPAMPAAPEAAPPPDVKQAMARMKLAAEKTDGELKETGRQRAVTNLAAEAHREKGRRGERFGHALGALAGAGGGAIAASRFLPGAPGVLGGAAAGYLAGGRLGREMGTEHDIRKNAAAVFAVAKMKKMANFGTGMTAPAAGELEPVNYLRAEMAARRAQEMNEANYYREQLSQNRAQTAISSQQMTDLQMQLQQAHEQQATVDSQLQQYAEQAAQANAAATQASMAMAQARMDVEQMKQRIMDAVSQPSAMPAASPGAVDAQHQQAQASLDPGVEADASNAGAAGQPPAPEQPAGPNGTAEAGSQGSGPEQKPPATEVTKTETTKTSNLAGHLLGGALGGITGAAGSYALAQKAPRLREQVEQLDQKGSFFDAARAAAAKAQLAGAELAASHPGRAAAVAGLNGAVGGAMLGPGILNQGTKLLGNLRSL